MVLSTPLPPREGIGFYVWNLGRYLVSQGHTVQLLTRSERLKPAHETVDGISIWRPRYYPLYPLHVSLHGVFLQRLVNRLEPEVDIFHLHTPLPPPIRTQRPILLTVHSLMLPDARARQTEGVYDLLIKLQSPVSTWLEGRMLRSSTRVTAVSPLVAQQVQARQECTCGPVEVAWNGVDSTYFTPGDQPPAQPPYLLYVGRLAPGKGLQDLVQAAGIITTRYPKVRLVIVGSGPQDELLRTWIDQAQLRDYVELAGHMDSRDALRRLYQQAWAFILPSHHEGLPGVVLETMACGTPAVATRVGGVPSVIEDGSNGLLVDPHSPDQIAHAVERLLTTNGLREQLGAAARRTIETRFAWQVIGKKYLDSYRQIYTGSAL